MLQNRVDPKGNIIITKARGAWLGNRGQLHNSGKTILRPFKHKAWIICLLQFKGRHREVMSPGLWTELFFLDEATAFSAGHRPCFECRREDANRFKAAWLKGNPEYGFSPNVRIGMIDDILQAERIGTVNTKVTFEADINDLPDGVFVGVAGEAFLVAGGLIYKWSPGGYGDGLSFPTETQVRVFTPRSVVNAFRNGYRPQIGIEA
jgi:hypothetical protein